MIKYALITGASAGIGAATAAELAGLGYSLILIARRKENLTLLKKSISKKHPKIDIQIHTFDITDSKLLKSFFKKISNLKDQIEVLVNNAGLARGVDKIPDAKLEDWEEMIQTNLTALLKVTRYTLPLLSKKTGFIVNLGSVAGRWVYPRGGVYCATKHAVHAFSEGLRMDLLGTGIRVCTIAPGMVETEFSEVRLKDKEKAKNIYKGMSPLLAQDIARTISWVISQPSHVNIQELVIYPTDQAAIGQVHRR